MLAEQLADPGNESSGGEPGGLDIDELVHDLRGPLSVIVAFAESIEGAEREERARFAERLVVNAHRALAVLEEFTALSDLRSEELAASVRPMDLGEVVARACDAAAPGLPRGFEISCIVPQDGLFMVGDRDLLEMGVRALLRRCARVLGPISLRLHVVGDDDLARVELHAEATGSNGRGLADLDAGEFEVLRRIVALHGGRVVFENDEAGLVVGLCMPRQRR
jgi:signal transduction histidine kinase